MLNGILGKKTYTLDNPLVTVITVCLNGEQYLEEAIRSVVSQTYQNIEYIIVDGGSTDASLDIIKKYEERISYWVSEPDSGIYNAMNKGINLSKGEIVYFLNADDFIYNEQVIERIVDYFKSNKDVQVVYGNVLILDPYDGFRLRVGREFTLHDLGRGVMFPNQNMFMKKEVLLENGLFDESFRIAGDYDMVTKAFLKGYKFKYVNEDIALFRLVGVSSDLNNGFLAIKENRQIVKRYFKRSTYIKYLLLSQLTILRHRLILKMGLLNYWRKLKMLVKGRPG